MMQQTTVYSKDNCPACRTAVAMLKSSGHEPTVMKLGYDYTLDDFRRKFPGERAVPQVVINEKHFNSLESLRIFLNSDT